MALATVSLRPSRLGDPPVLRADVVGGEATYWSRRWGLVEHWALNEASGGALASVSAANNLTDNNTVTSNPGKVYGTARQFTAANLEFLSLADNAALSTGDIDFWLSAWVYLDTVPSFATIVQKGDSAGAAAAYEYALLLQGTTGWRFEVSNGTTSTTVSDTTVVPATATWTHLLGWHDAVNNTVNLRVNARAAVSAAHTVGASDSALNVAIGGGIGASVYMNGRIGPVAFGKSPPGGIAALATEISDRLYNGGSGRAYPWR